MKPSQQQQQQQEQSSLTNLSLEQLLVKLHEVLMQCQCLSDQKMKLTSQVMEMLSNKARQLINWSCVDVLNNNNNNTNNNGLEASNNNNNNNTNTNNNINRLLFELDEKKIINDFKASIKRNGMSLNPVHLTGGNGSATNSNGHGNNSGNNNGRTSSRFNHQTQLIKAKQSLHPTINGTSRNNNNNNNTIASSMTTTTTTTMTSLTTNVVNSTSSVTTTTTASTASSNTTSNANLVDAYSFDDQSSNFQNASPPPLFANSKSYKPLRNTSNNNNNSGILSYSAKKYTNSNTSRANSGCSDVNNNVNSSLKKTIKKLKLENGNSTATSVAAQNSPSTNNNNLDSNVIIFYLYLF